MLANKTFCGPKFTGLFSRNAGEIAVDHIFFPILYIWSGFGDIGDQSRKLSIIAPNFGRFFVLPNFRNRVFKKLYPCYDPCLAARHMENVLWGYSTIPKLYGLTRWILNQILNFHDKIFCGTPSQFGCALARLGQSVARVKLISGCSTSQGPKNSIPKSAF